MLKPFTNSPVWVLCGLSVALTSCTGTSGEVGAGNRPTRFISIQPIQVCNDFGLLCADVEFFEAETKKLWSQADIQVDFLAPVRLNGTRFLTIDSRDEFAELSFDGGTGAFGRHPFSTRTSGPINMWFVERIFDGLFENFGWSWIDQNGIVISDDIIDFNNGIGRRDTVAHEIGHNLGLTHSNLGAGPANNLMTDGRDRNVPNSVNDITPDGAGLGQLTPRQVDYARDSSLVDSSPGPSQRSGEVGIPFPLPLFLDTAAPQEMAYSADAISLPVIPEAAPPAPIVEAPAPEATLPAPLVESSTPVTDKRLQQSTFSAPLKSPVISKSAAWDDLALSQTPEPEGKPPVAFAEDESLALPTNPPASIQLAETEPAVQLAARSDLVAASPPSPPQQIPNGPGMSLVSVGMLVGYLWRKRPHS